MKERRQTLGENIKPLNYNILLEPNLDTFKYKGKETIDIEIKEGSREVRLNAASLRIIGASIECKGLVQKAKIRLDKRLEQLILNFGKVVKGNAKLNIQFNGTNNDSMRGFYRSRYTYKGKNGYILTSQFEAADARKAFPCFDEPALKATYDLSFIIDKDLGCISNMPVKTERSTGKGKKLVSFYTTPIMSSYLLYLGVGKFERRASKYRKMEFGVVTVPGKSKDALMAMGFGKKFLEFFESYFGIDFPLPKIDLLAIPDFSAGAMENWGAITFREIELLGDEKSTPTSTKQRIAEVIAHELAHQWFGDLVTMKWWDDLWLNESFATFMATKAVDSVFPKWEFGLQDSVDTFSTAFSADQYVSTHPINVIVNEPAEIDEIFDRISYEKGGSLLAMLEDYAGKEPFRKGLHNYLKRHSYSNATKHDLWNSIEDVLRKSGNKARFAEMAEGWIDKTGYPIVEVSKNGIGTLSLNQERYLLLKDRKINELWQIPIHYETQGGKKGHMLLDTRSELLKANDDSIKLNHMQKGLYRVRYADEILKSLGNWISSGKMDNIDAWGVENDFYALARSSRMKVDKYLDFVEKYCMYGNYPLSFGVSSHLSGLAILLSDNNRILKRVKELNIRYHNIILEKVGWNESKIESNITTLARSMAIARLGIGGDKNVLKKSREIFDDYLTSGRLPPKNIRSAVYNINAWNGDENTYNKLVELYKKENVQDDKRKLLVALSNSSRPEIIERALAFCLSEDVRLQDGFVVCSVVSSNEVGKKLIWGWTRKNWKEFMRRYSSGTHMLQTFVNNLGLVDDEKTKKEIEVFFAKKENRRKDIERTLSQLMELIEANIHFKEYNEK